MSASACPQFELPWAEGFGPSTLRPTRLAAPDASGPQLCGYGPRTWVTQSEAEVEEPWPFDQNLVIFTCVEGPGEESLEAAIRQRDRLCSAREAAEVTA